MPDSHVRDCFWLRHAGVGRLKLFGLQSRISICWRTFSHAKLVQATFPTGLSKKLKHDSLDALTLTVTTFVTCA